MQSPTLDSKKVTAEPGVAVEHIKEAERQLSQSKAKEVIESGCEGGDAETATTSSANAKAAAEPAAADIVKEVTDETERLSIDDETNELQKPKADGDEKSASTVTDSKSKAPEEAKAAEESKSAAAEEAKPQEN